MASSYCKDAEERMKKAVESTLHEFNTTRTGRATPNMLDGIQIEYYGARTAISQLATITVPEPRLLVVQPWDKSLLREMQKAITSSNLGLNPNSDGAVLRILIPELTEERRKDLVKVVRKAAEDGRIAIRNIRRDAIEVVRKDEKAAKLSEDDSKREQTDLQKLTDKHIEQINQLLEDKEKGLLTV